MQLIGMLDSPYVRRTAISLKLLGIPFEHRALSVFGDFQAFGEINPVVKAPTLVTDDGIVLMDSTLILDYAEVLAGGKRSLMPSGAAPRLRVLSIIGLALAACEKTVQIVYERNLRPPEKQHEPWLQRIDLQLRRAYAALALAADKRGSAWLTGETLTQADVSLAVAWSFTHFMLPELAQSLAERYPALTTFSALAEALPEFVSTPGT